MKNFDFFPFFREQQGEKNTSERESFKLSGYGESKKGDEAHGSINDDYFLWRPDLGLAAICDGLENNYESNSASAATIRELPLLISQLDKSGNPQQRSEQLRKIILDIHKKIAAREISARGFTTLSAILIEKDREAIIAHTGNSRIYLIRKKQIFILTIDQKRALMGIPSKDRDKTLRIFASAASIEQIPKNLQENYQLFIRSSMSSVLGAEPLNLQITQQQITRGDRLVLCTDGISDHLTLPKLLTLCSGKNPESAVRSLIEEPGDIEYNRYYPNDDKTAIIVDVN